MDILSKPKYIDAGDMSGNLDGQELSMRDMVMAVYTFTWTGSPIGDIVIEGSIDGSTWFTLDTIAAGGGPGVESRPVMDFPYPLIRSNYESASGSGTLNTQFFAKGFA